uniref:ATP-grasp domain-containing protein n=1 Tax=Candidatus Enterococcus mansonii TaxID=1834181 RepID=A0A242CK26_9ENTE|nr:hypothetical protein A5880_001288 [Enterococcus sp. 4G2_DIV0659]
MDAIGLTDGPAHVEVKYTSEGPKIIEVNGRPGGDNITSDLIKNAYGIDIFKQTVLKYLGEPIAIKKEANLASAIGYILSDQDKNIAQLQGLDEVLKDSSITRYEVAKGTIENVRAAKSSDDRLGYIIIQEQTAAEAKQKIMALISQIYVK